MENLKSVTTETPFTNDDQNIVDDIHFIFEELFKGESKFITDSFESFISVREDETLLQECLEFQDIAWIMQIGVIFDSIVVRASLPNGDSLGFGATTLIDKIDSQVKKTEIYRNKKVVESLEGLKDFVSRKVVVSKKEYIDFKLLIHLLFQ